MTQNESVQGNAMPYGAPIRDAIASGDRARMTQVAEHARRWLQDNPGHANQGDVHAALRELEQAQGGRS